MSKTRQEGNCGSWVFVGRCLYFSMLRSWEVVPLERNGVLRCTMPQFGLCA